MIHLDTHVIAWLYQGHVQLIPAPVRALLEEHDLAMSPMAGLELRYLFEIDRVSVPEDVVLAYLARKTGLSVDPTPFADVVACATSLDWTRDPFDRLIVGQAMAAGAPLITKDLRIREHFPQATWD